MKYILVYIFTVPASILFYIAEKILGEKIGWRVEEVVEGMTAECTKCGHCGEFKIKK